MSQPEATTQEGTHKHRSKKQEKSEKQEKQQKSEEKQEKPSRKKREEVVEESEEEEDSTEESEEYTEDSDDDSVVDLSSDRLYQVLSGVLETDRGHNVAEILYRLQKDVHLLATSVHQLIQLSLAAQASRARAQSDDEQ